MAAKPPDAAKLYEAALLHLARYGATEAGMARVLSRKLDRWARHAQDAPPEDTAARLRAARAAIPGVIEKLRLAGALNDGAFAAGRARRLSRAGKSRRGALAHLAAAGIPAAIAGATLAEDPARELAAACAYLRRRRAGPFGDVPELKILGAMARAGYSQTTARQALRLDRNAAEALIKTLQAG